jgi:transposase
LSCPPLDNLLPDLAVDERQISLLSQDQSILKRVSEHEARAVKLWRETISVADLLSAAAEWTLPLAEVAEMGRPFTATGMGPAEYPVDKIVAALGDHPPDPLVQSLCWDDDQGTYRLDVLDLARYAQKTSRSVGSLEEVLEQLAVAGFDVKECLEFAEFCSKEDGE